MKKISLLSAIALSGLFYSTANAQILQIGLRLGGSNPIAHVSLNTPAISVSYNAADDYYYLPDVDAYYSVYENRYYYFDGDTWIAAAYLPGEYRNYDWRTARRYEVKAHRPYMNNDVYRERYKGNVGAWGRYDNHSSNYANRDDHRNNDMRFERRDDNRRGAEHADNRGQENYNQPNRGQGGDSQPSQPDRSQGNYGRQPQSGRSGDNHSQPAQQGRGKDQQPTHQNGSGQQQRGNNSGDQHQADDHTRSARNIMRS